jgi:hypothetical protein
LNASPQAFPQVWKRLKAAGPQETNALQAFFLYSRRRPVATSARGCPKQAGSSLVLYVVGRLTMTLPTAIVLATAIFCGTQLIIVLMAFGWAASRRHGS